MIYTVGEMAQKLGVPASTLRYYDKEGLLPFVERSSGGIRMFRENDFEWLQVIRCMKKAGMSIKDPLVPDPRLCGGIDHDILCAADFYRRGL